MKAGSRFGALPGAQKHKKRGEERALGSPPPPEPPRALPAVCNQAPQGSAPAPLPNYFLAPMPGRAFFFFFGTASFQLRHVSSRHRSGARGQEAARLTRRASFGSRGRSGDGKAQGLELSTRVLSFGSAAGSAFAACVRGKASKARFSPPFSWKKNNKKSTGSFKRSRTRATKHRR